MEHRCSARLCTETRLFIHPFSGKSNLYIQIHFFWKTHIPGEELRERCLGHWSLLGYGAAAQHLYRGQFIAPLYRGALSFAGITEAVNNASERKPPSPHISSIPTAHTAPRYSHSCPPHAARTPGYHYPGKEPYPSATDG